MNIIQQMVRNRAEVLLKELGELADEVISEGQRKSNSTSVADFTTASVIDPKMAKRIAVIHIQLKMLENMVQETDG